MDYKFPSTKNNETLCNSDLNIEAGVEQKKYNGKLYVVHREVSIIPHANYDGFKKSFFFLLCLIYRNFIRNEIEIITFLVFN